MTFRLALAVLLAVSLPLQSAAPGDAPLFAALQRGDAREVAQLLKDGANANAVDRDGMPALMAATLFAGADMVELLLKNGANPNQADTSGATPLMWAVPDTAKLKLLVAKGANVNAK